MHDGFWTIWKYLGLVIIGMEILLLVSVFVATREWGICALWIMFVLALFIIPLAAIDIYQATH